MTTKDSSRNDSNQGRLCRAGSWKNLYDDSDLGGYKTAPCTKSTAAQCPGGCWLENVKGSKADILNNYWDPSGAQAEPNNRGSLQTKAFMQTSEPFLLFDAHEGQILQSNGAIYLCKLK